jgi:Transglutaminase-like superfamily
MIQTYRRFVSLDRTRRRLVIEAAVLMVIGWAGLRLFRFQTLRRLLDHVVAVTSSRQPAAEEDVVACVRRAVVAVAARCPAATCLVQALAADVMLRRRGLSCIMRFGVRLTRTTTEPLEGHAWVECGGSTIDAIDGRSAFTVLSR